MAAGCVPGLCQVVGVCGDVRRLACRGSMCMLGAHRICWVDLV